MAPNHSYTIEIRGTHSWGAEDDGIGHNRISDSEKAQDVHVYENARKLFIHEVNIIIFILINYENKNKINISQVSFLPLHFHNLFFPIFPIFFIFIFCLIIICFCTLRIAMWFDDDVVRGCWRMNYDYFLQRVHPQPPRSELTPCLTLELCFQMKYVWLSMKNMIKWRCWRWLAAVEVHYNECVWGFAVENCQGVWNPELLRQWRTRDMTGIQSWIDNKREWMNFELFP